MNAKKDYVLLIIAGIALLVMTIYQVLTPVHHRCEDASEIKRMMGWNCNMGNGDE